jgi:hypothetical protein
MSLKMDLCVLDLATTQKFLPCLDHLITAEACIVFILDMHLTDLPLPPFALIL